MMGHPAFDLDWNLVRTFAAVARSGSLSGGARQLGIAHPTAARHIQQLEEALGVSLFSRTGKGLLLNEAGQNLSDAATMMHNSALAFQAVSDRVRHRPLERVRVSVSELLSELLPDVLLRELSDGVGTSPPAEGLRVDMVVTNATLNLLERDADIALRHTEPEQQELLCRRVGQVEMGLFARGDYVARYGMVETEHLNRHRFIDGMSRDYLVRGAANRGLLINPDQVVLRSDSLAAQRAAVSGGWGVAALPVWMADGAPDWQPVFAPDEVINVEVWLAARPEVRDSEQLYAVFRQLGEGLAQHLAGPANGSKRQQTLSSDQLRR